MKRTDDGGITAVFITGIGELLVLSADHSVAALTRPEPSTADGMARANDDVAAIHASLP